jgi:hypothetical protein
MTNDVVTMDDPTTHTHDSTRFGNRVFEVRFVDGCLTQSLANDFEEPLDDEPKPRSFR